MLLEIRYSSAIWGAACHVSAAAAVSRTSGYTVEPGPVTSVTSPFRSPEASRCAMSSSAIRPQSQRLAETIRSSVSSSVSTKETVLPLRFCSSSQNTSPPCSGRTTPA